MMHACMHACTTEHPRVGGCPVSYGMSLVSLVLALVSVVLARTLKQISKILISGCWAVDRE